jgi:hypothetical protein
MGQLSNRDAVGQIGKTLPSEENGARAKQRFALTEYQIPRREIDRHFREKRRAATSDNRRAST